MDKKYSFEELELNPLKQFMFPPCKDTLMLLDRNEYREQIASYMLGMKDRLNTAIVMQHIDGRCEVVTKIDITAEEWSFAKERVVSEDMPIAVITIPEKRGKMTRKESIQTFLEPFDYYAVLIEEKEGQWKISHVPPYHEMHIELGEEEYDFFAQCMHFTTEMPKEKPVKAEEWRQKFTYNGVDFVLIASRTPDKVTDYSLEIDRYVSKAFIFGITEESEEDVLERMDCMIYELFRKNPRVSDLGFAINHLLEQVARNEYDAMNIVPRFVEYGMTDEEREAYEDYKNSYSHDCEHCDCDDNCDCNCDED